MTQAIKLLSFLFFLCLIACTPKPKIFDSSGKPINLSDYQGKWIVVNYWADWCAPCHKEIPQLNLFYAAYKDKNIAVFGVNFDNLPGDQLQRLALQNHIAYPLLITNPAKYWGINEIATLPATFIISPEGKVVKKLLGEQTKQSLELAIQGAKQ